MVVTDTLIQMARNASACDEGLRSLRPGMSVHEVKSQHLAWFAERFPNLSALIVKNLLIGSPVPLRGRPDLALFGYGYGDGDGKFLRDVVDVASDTAT